MNDIQIFNNPEFGEIRIVTIDGKDYFYGIDIATALMYKRPRKAVLDSCKNILSPNGSVLTQDDEPIISEGDMYRLIIKASSQSTSKDIKDKAGKFEKWVFDEVLPSIRKNGSYQQSQLPQTTDGKIALLAQGHMELKEEVDTIKADLEALKMDLPILPIEAERITEAVKKKGVMILGGKTSSAYNDRGIRQKLYNDLYSNLKYNFGVRSYKSIKRSQCDKAIEIIKKYEPPYFLQERINSANSQQKLDL
jgi:prophage antirepressor-like protein